MKLNNIITTILIQLPLYISCYKILIHCDIGTRSHVKGMLEIGNYLNNIGHEAIFVSQKVHGSYVKGYNVSHFVIKGEIDKLNDFNTIGLGKKEIDVQYNMQQTLKVLPKLLVKAYRLNYQILKEHAKQGEYDVMVCDFIAHACQDIAKGLGIPLIVGYQSIDNILPLISPFKVNGKEYGPLSIQGMNIFERYYYKIIKPLMDVNSFVKVKNELEKVRKEYNVHSNSYFGDLKYGLSLANSFFGLELATPVPPNIKIIGPLNTLPNKELDDNLNDFLNRNNNTLFIGFGSFVQLGPKTITKILQFIFYSLEHKLINGVIWGLARTDITTIPDEIHIKEINKVISKTKLINNEYDNIIILKWAPQYSILNHNNTKLFLSHGGMESLSESITTATAILCMPITGDQPRNARKVVDMGIGIYINAEEFNLKYMIDKINQLIYKRDLIDRNLLKYQLITQNSYKKVKHAADIVLDYIKFAKMCRRYQPYENGIPCELEHLIPKSEELNYFVANGVDIIIINFILSILIFYLVVKAIHFIIFKVYCWIKYSVLGNVEHTKED